MTNFDRVKEELKIEDIGGCAAIHRLRNEETCLNRNCDTCFEWLADEYKGSITLTESERVILENIDKEYRYIARDKNNNLHIHKRKPMKTLHFWDSGSIFGMNAFRHLFKFIKWEDEKPYSISDLIKGV